MRENNQQFNLEDPYQIAGYIASCKKRTPVKLYVNLAHAVEMNGVEKYGTETSFAAFMEYDEAQAFLEKNRDAVVSYRLENDRRNSGVPMGELGGYDARIEPGALIRNGVKIEKDAVIMMGAVLNIGACVGEKTMIDMNAVLGARATVGKRCHIGAGAVLAGVLEPPSKSPVIVEDDVLIGANAVVLEGVKIGRGSVVAAGSVVTQDVGEGCVVAGAPARFIKEKDEKTSAKTEILDALRK